MTSILSCLSKVVFDFASHANGFTSVTHAVFSAAWMVPCVQDDSTDAPLKFDIKEVGLYFSRMRSEGSPFIVGVWGWTCVRVVLVVGASCRRGVESSSGGRRVVVGGSSSRR